MRPICNRQNAFRFPLNAILGTEAQIRLLRVMTTEVSGPITVTDAAERAGLTPPGARKAMKRLVTTGLVQSVGGGRKHLYEISRNDVLVLSIVAMFKAETKQYESILTTIGKLVERIEPIPVSAWLTTLPANKGDPIRISILQDSKNIGSTVRNLQKLLQEVESEFDMTIEVIGFTRADTPQMETDSILLFGLPPDTVNSMRATQARSVPSHNEVDQRLSEMCRIIAKMISEDRSIVERARQYTHRILDKQSDLSSGDIGEWRDILDEYSIRRLIHFMTSEEERAVRLRQSCPFFAILSNDERERISVELESNQ